MQNIKGRNSLENPTPVSDCTLAARRVLPGDILLTRVPMSFDDPESWPSHIIQKATRSRFSHGALCVGEGLFIEAVGTGVGRLAVFQCGLHDPTNICLLRLRKSVAGGALFARRAAAIGQEFLAQGFSRRCIPGGKGSAFDHPQRAASLYMQVIARAYDGAGLPLVPDKDFDAVTPGDLQDCALLEEVTETAVQPARADKPPHFFLDDNSLFERPHHWEVVTKLKILCGDDVKRVLHGLKARPASFSELELLLAQRQLRPLDAAMHRGLTWYRFSEVYLEKKLQQLTARNADRDAPLEQLLPSILSDNELDYTLLRMLGESEQLERERLQRFEECRLYHAYCEQFPGKTFGYLAELHGRLHELGAREVEAVQRQVLRLRQESERRGIVLKVERRRVNVHAQPLFDPLKA